MDKILEQVKAFAEKAHGSQKRKYTPEPYMVHPLRVMEICRPYNNSLPVLAAALLHDVLEDTPVSKEELNAFLKSIMTEQDAQQTTKLVVELTDVYVKDKYPYWNRRKRKQKEASRIEKTSADSQTIKYADIIDNCPEIARYDPEFGPRFLKECQMLLKVISKGNPELYKKAIEVVDQNLRKAPKQE